MRKRGQTPEVKRVIIMKLILKRILTLMLLLTVVFSISGQPVYAGGATWEETHHIGKYYFKYNNDKNRLYISKKKNSGFRKTPVTEFLFASNGKQVMYLSNENRKFYIMSYDIKTKKIKKVKKLPKADYWQMDYVIGGCFWLDNEKDIYRYSVKKNKLKRMKKDAMLLQMNGSYFLTQSRKARNYKNIDVYFGDENGGNTYDTPIDMYDLDIYKISDTGKFKKVKSLGTTYGYAEYVKNDKTKTIYYTKSGAHKLYKIKYNGKNKELVAEFSGYIARVFDDCCYVVEDETAHVFNYKTELMWELQEKEW